MTVSSRAWRKVCSSAFLAVALFAPSLAAAQSIQTPAAVVAESTLDAHTRQLAAQLRCPVCQGLSLQDSPSELSQQMRDLVRQQLAEGKSPEEVKAYFVARYGEWILMQPEAHGFNWAVYLLPVAALGIGAWILIVALRRWTVPPSGTDGTPQQSGGHLS